MGVLSCIMVTYVGGLIWDPDCTVRTGIGTEGVGGALVIFLRTTLKVKRNWLNR